MTEPAFTQTPDGHRLAYHKRAAGGDREAAPGVVFLGGFKSDMTGTKALHLQDWAERCDVAFLRFDYFGHGASGGDFLDGTIGRWTADALHAIDELTTGPQILVGSSMGGWIAINAALRRPDRVAGFVGIAAAPDFTEDLMWAGFSPEAQARLRSEGSLSQPSEYDEEPYVITYRLIEEGRNHLCLRQPLDLRCPVRLLQGMADPDVPWQTGMRIVDTLAHDDAQLTLIKDGDHRLSKPHELALLTDTLARLIE